MFQTGIFQLNVLDIDTKYCRVGVFFIAEDFCITSLLSVLRDGQEDGVKIIHLKPILLKLIRALNGLTSSGISNSQAGKKMLVSFFIKKVDVDLN